MSAFITVMSVISLAGALWILFYQLPRARRAHDRFAVIGLLVTALLALLGWLLWGVPVRSW